MSEKYVDLSNLPILGQPKTEPMGLYIGGKCPQCGNPIFVHVAPGMAPCAYKVCLCNTDRQQVPLGYPAEYDAQLERHAADVFYQMYNKARQIVMEQMQQISQLKKQLNEGGVDVS